MPFFVSTAGYGIYFDTARYAEFEFGRKKPLKKTTVQNDGAVKLSTEELYKASALDETTVILVQIPVAAGVDIYIIEGTTVTDIVAQYNMLSGGGCDVPEWGLGTFYRCCSKYSQDDVYRTAKYFRERDLPCSVIGLEPGWQTQTYSSSFVWSESRFPDPDRLLSELCDMDYHVNLWEHAFVHPQSPMYDELLDCCGDYTVWGGLVPDFAIQKARDVFSSWHEKGVMLDKVDGFKLDECDGSDYVNGWSFPNATAFQSGADGEQYHSMFGVLYMQTMTEALRGKETFSQVRNAGALCASYPFVLYSDLYEHKDFIRGVVNAGFSGILWTPELRHADTKEELLRRLQTVVFSPQCLINAWYCEEVPWKRFDCEDEVRKWLKERERLIPRLKKAFERYKKDGVAPFRALVSDYTDDTETYSVDDEYLVGDDMLVAPIAVGENGREVYLPKGKWKDYFTGRTVQSGRFFVETQGIPVFVKEK